MKMESRDSSGAEGYWFALCSCSGTILFRCLSRIEGSADFAHMRRYTDPSLPSPFGGYKRVARD